MTGAAGGNRTDELLKLRPPHHTRKPPVEYTDLRVDTESYRRIYHNRAKFTVIVTMPRYTYLLRLQYPVWAFSFFSQNGSGGRSPGAKSNASLLSGEYPASAKNRSCTDVFFLILMALFLVSLVSIFILHLLFIWICSKVGMPYPQDTS